MGLPNISITFKSLAKSAIERSERGVVALIIKDTKDTNQLLTINSIKDIPSDLSEDNQEQIRLAFLGAEQVPKKILVYVLSSEGKTEDALNALEVEKFDYLAVPSFTEGDGDKISTWIKALRQDNTRIQAVLPNVKGDNEAIINFTTSDIKTETKTYTNVQYCSRVAGILASLPLNLSATYYVLPEVIDVPHTKKTDANQKINNGELILINDGEKCKIARAVNSLTTTNEDKTEDYKKIKIVSIMDMIYNDISKTFEDNYVGKYANSFENQSQFCISVSSYFEELARQKLLAQDSNNVQINIEAMKEYWKQRGIDLSKANQQELEEKTCGSNVFLKAKIKILDAIEDLQFNIDMQ